MIRRFGFTLLLSFICQLTLADLPYAGVWSGTLGKQKIMVCFDDYGSSYYYLKYLTGIPLALKDKKLSPFEWYEGERDKQAGEWKLDKVAATHMQGQWLAVGKEKSLPIDLNLLSPTLSTSRCSMSYLDDDADSPSSIFNAPRIQAVKSSSSSYGGAPFQYLCTLGGCVQLPESVVIGKKANQFINSWLKFQTKKYYECNLSNGDDGNNEWSREMSTKYFSNSWLSLRDNLPSVYCGGAHSSNDVKYYTIELKSGLQINVLGWFSVESSEHVTSSNNDYSEIPEDLLRLIESMSMVEISKNQMEDLCANHDHTMQAYLGEGGIVFYLEYPQVIDPCSHEVIIPYNKLTPYLNGKGKIAVESLINENIK